MMACIRYISLLCTTLHHSGMLSIMMIWQKKIQRILSLSREENLLTCFHSTISGGQMLAWILPNFSIYYFCFNFSCFHYLSIPFIKMFMILNFFVPHEMVFCYQNCSDDLILWEKIVLVIEKIFLNSRLKAENLQKNWDH